VCNKPPLSRFGSGTCHRRLEVAPDQVRGGAGQQGQVILVEWETSARSSYSNLRRRRGQGERRAGVYSPQSAATLPGCLDKRRRTRSCCLHRVIPTNVRGSTRFQILWFGTRSLPPG